MNYKKIIFIICASLLLGGAKNTNGQTTLSFNYVSDTTQTWTVPPCANRATVQLWAGGGAGGNNGGFSNRENEGGSSSYYMGVLSGLIPGTILDLYVPSGGKYNDISDAGGAGGWPGGGEGGQERLGGLYTGGGGGGYAAIEINGNWYVVAGGGGGGGSGSYVSPYYSSHGGSGGATTGGNGGIADGFFGGYGGTISTGGAPGFPAYFYGNTAGSSFLGGHGPVNGDSDPGGGGGGGYFGGGGGGNEHGGGGGGSSYPASTFNLGGITFTPISNLQGSADSNNTNNLAPGSPPDTSIGMGGYHQNGGNGLILITYGGNQSFWIKDSVLANPVCGICNGSIIAKDSGGFSPYAYSWAPSGQTTATATGLCANTYTVTVTDNCGNTSTASIVLTATPLPVTAKVTANLTCNGNCIGSATATVGIGTPPYTYLWAPTGGSKATATGLCAGIYTITVTDINGCTGSATATITQPTALTLTQWTNNVICTGGLDSAMVAPAGGVSPYTYLWTPSAQTTAMVTGLSTGAYTVKVTDLNGCTETVNVDILHPPLFMATMGVPNNVLCYGGVGNATVTANGGVSPYIYSWSPAGGSNAMGTGLSAGNYDVTITDRNGCTATAGVIITQPALLTATISASNNVPCNGGVGNATVTAGGGTLPYTYSWNPTAQSTATATGLIAGAYTIKVSDNHGCTATAGVSITQPTLLTATISATNHVPCNGGVGNATVTAGGGTSPYTYLWSPTAQTIATATGLAAGVYTIKVSDIHGCTATNTVTITEPAVLTATMGTPNRILCNGGTGNVTVAVSGGTNPYTYLWTPSAETNALATGLYVGTYSVTVTDAHHCTASATVIMTQPAILTATVTSTTGISCTNGNNGTATAKGGGGITPYTYLWTPSAETNATATNLFAGSYTITITDANGCTATATTALSQPTPVTATISEPKIICKDSTGILIANPSGGTPNYTYTWSSGGTLETATVTPTFTNDYSVTVSDAKGCTATATIVLQYGPSFAVNITGKRSVCVGDSTLICANAIGAIDGVTYLWEPENSTNECISASPSSVSVYTVTVVDGCGSTTTANTTVYTEPTPVVNMDVNFSQGCVPFCVQFLNNSNLSQGKVAQYTWNFGDGDSSYTKQPVYCYKTSGEYDVSLTVVSDSGCSATLKRVDMITIYGPPKASFTYSPQPASIETPRIQFIDQSTDVYGIAYQWWTFGDESDSTSNAENPIHTYHDTGTYCVTLIVMNNGGCMDTVTNCLVIEPAFKLYIPSAFTPNGDNRNEVFQAVGQYVKSFEMYVFDRWGMELFHSTNINQGWNGTIHGAGAICQEDVYIYKITVTDSEDNQHSYVGNVTLLK